MKKIFLFLILLGIAPQSRAQTETPTVVILGVEHTAQLINSNHQPAVLRAFIEKVNPVAIFIERSPEEFSKNDFYEFTYEQQYVIVPFSRKNKIPLYPIDWIPTESTLDLAFGVSDLEVPNFTRNPSGFWGFTVFTDSTTINKDFYFADDEGYSISNKEWYAAYPDNVNFDFARRLFLYRTFLQSKRIQAGLRNFNKDDTILVVIGALHKDDIEKNLAGNGYTILQPSTFGGIREVEIDNNFEEKDAYAILSFNLLGMQSNVGIMNKKLIDYSFRKIEVSNSVEIDFFKAKYELLTNKTESKEGIAIYQELLKKLEDNKRTPFTWNGVNDKSRIDSYVDPFGNLNLYQRIQLELAREYLNTNNKEQYEAVKTALMNQFSGYKQNMLMEYWKVYIEK